MILLLGLVLVVMGVVGEATTGTWFREFFNPEFPRGFRPWSDFRHRVLAQRVMLCVGVLLIGWGGITELI